jgi:hypothetical protein
MNIPQTLEGCFKKLIKQNSNKDLCAFSSIKEEKDEPIINGYYFSLGMYLRNNWGLWKGENKLVKYFNNLGIYHPDDMSSIIITSFHRHLNKKDIKLEEQIKYYQDFWKKVGYKDGNPKNNAKENYKGE